jgi:hypothetical protein
MTSYEVQPDVCLAIFAQAEEAADRADEQHVSMSSEVDELRGLCSRGESAPIASALSGVYNRLLTRGMTGATQQIRNAASGGRQAVGCIQRGDHEIADRNERAAREVDEVKISDGKPL